MPSILVVEDNPTARKMVRLALETEGFRVVEAADGAAALERARVHPPDLILQDMVLPDMDGAELVARLRELPGGGEVPIIGLSGFQHTLARVKARATRLDAFLLKPVEPLRLLEAIRQHLPPRAAVATPLGKGRHVLVVDDQLVELKRMRVGLEQFGFRVTTASDGVSAVALAQRLRPDLVLIDVLMPGFDGFDVCLAVRRDPDLANVRLVLISSHYVPQADVAQKFGAAAFVPRTTDIESIAHVIVSALTEPVCTTLGDNLEALRHAHSATVIDYLQRQAAINNQLAERCALQTAQLSILAGVADAVARYTDIQPVLDDVLGACLDAGGITKGAVYRADPGGAVVVAHAKGFSAPERELAETAFGWPELIAQALAGSVVTPRRVLTEAQWSDGRARAGVDAAVVVPLLVDKRCVGALFLGSLNDGRVTDDDLLSFGRAIAGYMGQALLVAGALAQKHYVMQLRALAQTAVDIGALLSMSDIANHITRRSREITGAEAAMLQVRLGDGSEVQAVSPPNVAEDSKERWMRFPIVDSVHGPIGDLRLANKPDGRLTEHDEAVAAHLAQLAAVSMENVRLHQAERAARTAAETSNRLKDEFLATLSHELRTPLTSIIGWSSMLENGLDETLTRKAIQTIARNAEIQRRLVSDILDISSIITGKVRLDLGPVDLADTIDDVIETIRPTARVKGVIVEAVLDRSGALVTGDVNRLRQVLWNLISNAVKFTPRGGRIEVHLERNSHVEVTVQDDGPGIAPEFLPRVFERFSQADGSTSRQHGGLGLGLALVRHFVELHGGTVAARNREQGGGAVFIVKLPRRSDEFDSEDAVERRSPAVETPVARAPLIDLAGVTVLVVDDDADACELLLHILGKCGATVFTASSSVDALALLASGRPDVLLCDIGMPGKDGLAIMREIRSLPAQEGGNVPAVALTAYGTAQDRVNALRAGFQMHVTKPVGATEIAIIVASLVKRL